MVRNCLTCHFFVKPGFEYTMHSGREGPKTFTKPTAVLSGEDRAAVSGGEYGAVGSKTGLGCAHKVWPDSREKKDIEPEIRRDRTGYCFWWEHREGMSIEAAQRLQQREEKQQRESREIRHTRTALVLAAIGLIITGLGTVGSCYQERSNPAPPTPVSAASPHD